MVRSITLYDIKEKERESNKFIIATEYVYKF